MSTKISELIITTDNLLKGIDRALLDYQVAALVKKEDRNLYDYIAHSNEICLEYQPTILSPKKFFFPQEEVILEYTADGQLNAKIEANPLVLFGIRPCDLNGFKIMSEAFADDHGDPNYLAKLEQTVVIGIDCKKICDKDAFCFKVGSQNANSSFDIMLYELDNNYAIEIATTKGQQFIDKYMTATKAQGNEFAIFQAQKNAAFGQEKPFNNLDQLPDVFEKNTHHPIWNQEGSRCLSCGSCVMVCPTCYCFDVKDEWQLNLKKGERIRKWDACMLSSFATISSGENFRHNATTRLHHRINRKFNFLMKKHGQPVCVGCGRCFQACLAKISPRKIAETINGEI